MRNGWTSFAKLPLILARILTGRALPHRDMVQECMTKRLLLEDFLKSSRRDRPLRIPLVVKRFHSETEITRHRVTLPLSLRISACNYNNHLFDLFPDSITAT